MLTVNEQGGIELSISHLLDAAPSTFADIIERYRSLQVRLFHHVVSSPECRYERRFGLGRVPAAIRGMSAESRLRQILCDQHIVGNPKGYFVNKHHPSLTASQLGEIKSVSFTFCDLEELAKHFAARNSRYGICFFHDYLETAGVRPVVYLNDQKTTQEQKQAVFNPHLLELQSNAYDMRWENEWRAKGELRFTPDDIAFLIVPDESYSSFTNWLEQNKMDYTLVPSSIACDPLDYLRMVPRVGYHSWWGQIEILGGLKLNFDEFYPYSPSDRTQMQDRAGLTSECLAKVDLQYLYEGKFVDRHRVFVQQLDPKFLNSALLNHVTRMGENANEPWHTSGDLTRAAYEVLFDIQGKRITKSWFPEEE